MIYPKTDIDSQQGPEEVLRTIDTLFEPSDVMEMRALNVNRTQHRAGCTYAGYFECGKKLAITRAVRQMGGQAEGIYVVLNRLKPELLARSVNRLQARPRYTTSDADILERRWLYIDVDAIRPAGISATDEEHDAALLGVSCVELGISNIRVIKKLERLLQKLEPLLDGLDQGVLTQAVKTLTLLGWSVYEPQTGPSLDYLQNRRGGVYPIGQEKVEISKEEAAWNAVLDAYEFTAMDEFDAVLLDAIQNGYFDDARVRNYGGALNSRFVAERLNQSFMDAWNLYHDSFAENEEEVVKAIYQASLQNAQIIGIVNLDSTVTLLKALGRREMAEEVLRAYVKHLSNDGKEFDLNAHPFRDRVNDPDVVGALRARSVEMKEKVNATDLLLSMATTRGWTQDALKTVSSLTTEEFRDCFKAIEGPRLRLVIQACLEFDRIIGAPESMNEIARRAKAALTLIGSESKINALRVAKYSVGPDVFSRSSIV